MITSMEYDFEVTFPGGMKIDYLLCGDLKAGIEYSSRNGHKWIFNNTFINGGLLSFESKKKNDYFLFH